jgi:hypothetical protein
MAYGAFVDKAHPPSAEEIESCLGLQWATWQDLTLFVQDGYKTSSELKYYGKNYGWALRYKKGGKALLSLYPSKDAFTAQIIFTEAEMQQAKTAGIGAGIIRTFEQANPYSEGRWLFIPVNTAADLQDIKKMLEIKLPRKARK